MNLQLYQEHSSKPIFLQIYFKCNQSNKSTVLKYFQNIYSPYIYMRLIYVLIPEMAIENQHILSVKPLLDKNIPWNKLAL